jgi:sedoheptulokinase
VSAIGITGQMHGILYLDERGNPVSPLYTWQDRRGEELCPQLRELTGYAAAPGYGLVTHCALAKSGQLPEGAWKIGTVMDYLTFRLCGKKRLLMHATNAASLGFFNIREGCFDREALRKIGVDPAILPEVTRDGEIVGCCRGIPVTVAIGDNQASFLGSVPEPETTVLANFGTGSQISLMVRDLTGVREEGGVEIRPFLKDSYLLCGSALCGGRAYAMLENFFRSFACRCGLGDGDVYAVLNEMADLGLRKQDLPRVQTTFCGTRQDPTVRGSIANIGSDNFTPEAFAAGLLVGMAQELYGLYSRMPHEGIGSLAASGNAAAKNPALLRALERVFSLPVSGCTFREEAAFGAACFAFR